MSKYIGNIFGYYKILEKTKDKDSYGHYMYKAQCINCGKIVYGAINDIIDCRSDKCRHYRKYIDTETSLFRDKRWKNKRIRCIYN